MNHPFYHFKLENAAHPEFQGQGTFHIPKALWQTSEPPQQLFIQGSSDGLKLLEKLPDYGLAIVGTRTPQARSIQLVKKTIEDLRGSNLIIISGLARGIDATAHSAAIEAGLATIAILGAGLDMNYPRENHELRRHILHSGGVIVSEFPPATPPRGFHFLRRNRLIAGWSRATWVVEASYRSGALNTARWARDQNKMCFAVPCYPGDPAFAGNQMLLDRDHALAFWNTHSLGSTWFELATHVPLHKKSIPSFEQKSTPLISLINKVQHCTSEQGGIQLQELFDWTATQGWSPEEFFTLLDEALRKKLMIDHSGTLLSI